MMGTTVPKATYPLLSAALCVCAISRSPAARRCYSHVWLLLLHLSQCPPNSTQRLMLTTTTIYLRNGRQKIPPPRCRAARRFATAAWPEEPGGAGEPGDLWGGGVHQGGDDGGPRQVRAAGHANITVG